METINKKECPKCKSLNVVFYGTSPELGDMGPGGKYSNPMEHPPVYKCVDCGELFIVEELE